MLLAAVIVNNGIVCSSIEPGLNTINRVGLFSDRQQEPSKNFACQVSRRFYLSYLPVNIAVDRKMMCIVDGCQRFAVE